LGVNITGIGILLYGIVKKTFNGGVLASLFRLNEAVSHTILNFKEYCVIWAYFERWQRQERKVRFWKKPGKTSLKLALCSPIFFR